MNVELKVERGVVSIWINNLLHLSFRHKDLKAIQSWIDDGGEFCIEYYIKGETLYTSYNSRELWEKILIEISEKCLLH